MNERIRELAEQAWDETKEEFGSFVDDSGEIDFTFLHAYTEKFAELIVRECEQVSLKNSHRNDDMGAIIAKQIKKHFVVKE